MTKISAEIVADSLSPQGDRLTSVLVTMPRIILSEMNTHRMLSKNTSSSRAIPFKKMVEAVEENPFIPIAWQKEHTGMQGYEYFTDLENDIPSLERGWLSARDNAIETAKYLNKCFENEDGSIEGLTKQLCNRLLEPFMWTTMLITGSKEGWDNFFSLRCPAYYYAGNNKSYKSKKELLPILLNDFGKSPVDYFWYNINKGQAEIHIMDLAEKIYDAMNESIPNQLKAGEWHIPFENKIDLRELANIIPHYQNNNGDIVNNKKLTEAKVQISTAMAAHTSYTTVGNEPVKTYEDWIKLHNKLVAYDPPHSSPMEHCARAMSDEEYECFLKGEREINKNANHWSDVEYFYDYDKIFGWCNNLKGFIPYRYFIDNKIDI